MSCRRKRRISTRWPRDPALQEQLEKDGEIMSPSEQRRIAKEVEDKQLDYQYMGNKLQKQLNDKRQELLQVMAPKLNAVLEDLIALKVTT